QKFKKNDYFTKEGKWCNKIGFIESGSARSYQYVNDKLITNWFIFNSMPLTSYASFVSKLPTKENIQFLENTTLTVISYSDLQILYNKYHGIERFGRQIAESYFIWQEERTLSLQSLSAKERYEELLVREPHLLQKISLGQIASYLGITQESLSRIRKDI
ncbi:MAG: Crp/Fnr family transcriptional regulator, partial [Salibacteraceae bacterium]